MMGRGLLSLVGVWMVCAGCLQSNQVQCLDGRVCPPGTICDDANGGCIRESQLGCTGDGACDVDGLAGTCRNGVCLLSVCGDGVATGVEQCDGTDLGGATCFELGAHQDGGVLACAANCGWDPSGCGTRCGDGTLDPAFEECEPRSDGPLFRDDKNECADLGFYYPGEITCTPQCTAASQTCSGRCGDEMIDFEHDEVCDGDLPTTESCAGLGYDAGTLGCSGFCTPGFSSCVQFGWKPMAASPNAIDFWGTAPDDVFAVVGSDIRHFDGTAWSELPLPPLLQSHNRRLVHGIWGTSFSNVYAVGMDYKEDGTNDPAIAEPRLYHFNGTAWSVQSTGLAPLPKAFTCIWGTGPNEIYVGGMGGFVMRWNGTAWQTSRPYGSGNNLRGIWGSSSNDIWAVGDAGGNDSHHHILHYDGTWTQIIGPSTVCAPCRGLNAIAGTGPNRVIAVGGDDSPAAAVSTALLFDGDSWAPMLVPTGPSAKRELFDVAAVGPSSIIAVGDDFQLHDAGDGWRVMYALDPVTAGRSVWGKSVDDVWLGASQTYRWHGSAWLAQRQPPALNTAITVLWGTAPDNVWAFDRAGNAGIRHFDGTSWSAVNSTTQIWSAWGRSETDIYAVGVSSRFFHYGADRTWTPLPLPAGLQSTVNLRKVWGTESELFVVGTDAATNAGRIGHYRQGIWNVEMLPANQHINGVWGTSATDVWAAGGMGPNGLLYHYDGVAWTRIMDPILMNRHIGDLTGAGTTAFALAGGELLRLDGNAWSIVPRQGQLPGGGPPRLFVLAPDDVFIAGSSPGGSDLAHYDGVMVTPVRTPVEGLSAIWGTPRRLFVGGNTFWELIRETAWRPPM